AAKQGTAAADTIIALLDTLENAAVTGDWAGVERGTAAIRSALAHYQPFELSDAEIQQRAQLLYLFIDLVYTEYQNGVRSGEITIEIEYREALTFRDQAAVVFEELYPFIAQVDPLAAERIADLLTEMGRVMAELGDKQLVYNLAAEARDLLGATLQVTAEPSNTSSSSFIVMDTLLDEIVLAVQHGDYDEAESTRLEAYALFENGPELRLAHRAPRLSQELEGLFWEGSGGNNGLSTLLNRKADPAEIETSVRQLKAKLDDAQGFLESDLTDTLAMLSSAAIIIREGLEAVLVLGAILGYLRATESSARYSRWVYLGVVGAVLLSVLTWWAAQSVITVSVQNRELMEGITSLVAVIVLFYVTNWLFHKTYVIDWVTFVKTKLKGALSNGSALTLAGLGFTVVYREGFETVLFYRALLFDADLVPVLVGFIAGSTVILLVAYGILRMSKQFPIKRFFTATTVLLLLLAFNFTGSGIRELQEAGTISTTLLSSVPENLILMEILGVFPTLETVLAQGLFVTLIAVTFTYSRWQGRRKIIPAHAS
ncbi:MAG: FTR1 family protein, partial [Chloroflexi bacterium]|nr:FTR1 family protein [Chloroflexota bacterium]